VNGGELTARVRTPLRGFDLDLELRAEAGAPVALVGRSGSGKTSLLRAIAGLLSPRSGRVALGETVWLDTDRAIDLAPERRGCGFLFQDYALFPRMNAWRNVAYGIRGPRRERRSQALAALDRFGVAGLAESRPGTISGGERQRVALARALAAQPPLLLLDEPLSALDSTTRREAIGELRAVFAETDTPVVLVTHSFEEAAALATELVVIDAGREVQRGGAAAISASPASAFVADFSGAVVLRGEAGGDGDLTVVRLPGGGEVRSIDRARGAVSVSVFPWEISLEAGGASPVAGVDSRLNRLACEVRTVTTIGSRARVVLAAPEPLVAEVTAASATRLDLRQGIRVTAVWKATATRLIADG
jgi:molybdate transport system ATP-binding protein